jgi:hypothetical protein
MSGLSLGSQPKGHVTLSPAALRVKYKGLRVKNTIFQNVTGGQNVHKTNIFFNIYLIFDIVNSFW